MKYKYETILGLITIALACSIIISVMTPAQICDPNEGCDVVLNSGYAHTLGMKNSYFGVIGFGVLFLLLLSHIKSPTNKKRRIIVTLVIVGAIISVYFLGVQQFILEKYCKYCIIADISAVLALIFTLIKNEKDYSTRG